MGSDEVKAQAKNMSEKEVRTLKITVAGMMVALKRAGVPVGGQLLQHMAASWDILRNPDEAPLSFQPPKKKDGPLIQLPFGEGYSVAPPRIQTRRH